MAYIQVDIQQLIELGAMCSARNFENSHRRNEHCRKIALNLKHSLLGCVLVNISRSLRNSGFLCGELSSDSMRVAVKKWIDLIETRGKMGK